VKQTRDDKSKYIAYAARLGSLRHLVPRALAKSSGAWPWQIFDQFASISRPDLQTCDSCDDGHTMA
jgi:hypothetical protein